MASQKINFISWNANGLKTNIDKKYEELKKADVAFLQETHSDNEADFKRLLEDFEVCFTKFSSSCKGAAILVKKRLITLDFKKESEEDDCGAYVVLKCSLEGQLYTLVSVYIHEDEIEMNGKTLDKLSRYLQSMTKGLLVIGGDFNTVLNPFIDKISPNWFKDIYIHKTLRSHLEKFMNSLQLVDVWRRKNPVDQNYTFHRNTSKSRLDYFFVPEECVWRVISCEIRDSEMPDHCPVYLEIDNVSVTQSEEQSKQLDDKITALRKKDQSQDKESLHALSEADIYSAILSLQVSDTPRPDNIPVSVYKHQLKETIPYIKMLHDRIYRGTFKCSENEFNKTEESPNGDSRFFNVDYLIIANILVKRLDDFLSKKSKKSNRREHNNPAFVMITPKTFSKTSLSDIEEKTQEQSNQSLRKDFKILHNLLRDAPDGEKQLHQGCPLTPVLKTLALKCFASTLKCNDILVYKESIILSVQPGELQNVKDAVIKTFKEECVCKILTRETVPGAENEVDEGEQKEFFLRTSEAVKKCEELVKGAEGFPEKLADYLSEPVELSLKYVVGKVMDRLFAKGSLSRFNWSNCSSKTGKEAFSKLKIVEKIIGYTGFMRYLK